MSQNGHNLSDNMTTPKLMMDHIKLKESLKEPPLWISTYIHMVTETIKY